MWEADRRSAMQVDGANRGISLSTEEVCEQKL